MTKSSKVPWPLLTTEAKTMARCVCLTRHLLVPILWPSPAHRAWSVVLTSSRPQTSPYISAIFSAITHYSASCILPWPAVLPESLSPHGESVISDSYAHPIPISYFFEMFSLFHHSIDVYQASISWISSG